MKIDVDLFHRDDNIKVGVDYTLSIQEAVSAGFYHSVDEQVYEFDSEQIRKIVGVDKRDVTLRQCHLLEDMSYQELKGFLADQALHHADVYELLAYVARCPVTNKVNVPILALSLNYRYEDELEHVPILIDTNIAGDLKRCLVVASLGHQKLFPYLKGDGSLKKGITLLLSSR